MLKSGTAVTIIFGPFAGFRATMVSIRLRRVVVRVVLRHEPSVLIELDDDMIERAIEASTP
jgi:hypothetical protein